MFPVFALILFLVPVLLYACSFFFGFVFDDRIFIVENPFIKSFEHLLGHFNGTFPLTRVVSLSSFALNYAMYGLEPFGFHVFNVMIHVGAVLAVWWLARLILIRVPASRGIVPVPDAQLRMQYLAFFTALLFAVHPVQVQAVAYISQRFASQATLFYLLSLGCYISARISQDRRGTLGFFGAFALFGLLAIMSKEEAVSLPLMVLAVELFFFSGIKALLTPRRLLIASVGILVFTVVFIKLFNSNILLLFSQQTVSASHQGDVFTLGTYLLTQIKVFVTFLRLLVWPFPQNLDYDYPMASSLFETGILLRLALIAGLILAVLRLRKQVPLIVFATTWVMISFSANLVPRANVIWEHKLYLISFGFVLLVVLLADHLIRSLKMLCIVLSLLALGLSAATLVREQVFKDQITLWEDCIKHSPHKWRVVQSLAVNYQAVGRYREAERLYEQVHLIAPQDPLALKQAGDFYFETGSFEKAIALYNQAIKQGTDELEIRHRLGQSYERMDNLPRAEWVYTMAMIVDIKSLVWRSDLHLKRWELKKAEKDALIVLNRYPDYVPALLALAHVYEARADKANAAEIYNQCVLLHPASEDVYIERALFLYKDNPDAAKKDLVKAFQLNPYSIKLKDAVRALDLH